MSEQRKRQVFISYSNRDKAVAGALRSYLEAIPSVTCWTTESGIEGGEDWQEAIVRAIRRSGLVVVLVSSATDPSRWVSRELLAADERKIPVLPIRLDDGPAPREIESLLVRYQSLNASEGSFASHLPQIGSAVRKILELPEAEAPPPASLRRRRDARSRSAIAVQLLVVVAVLAWIAFKVFGPKDAIPTQEQAKPAAPEKPREPPRPRRDPDPVALQPATWVRALFHGDPDAAWSGVERERFPRIERQPWRRQSDVLSKEAFDELWAAALERIVAGRHYPDLVTKVPAKPGPSSTAAERIARLVAGAIRMAPDPTLIPLGPDPVSKLEEFAVVGSGRVRLRHPDPATPGEGRLLAEPGDAIVLVLVPGAERHEALTARYVKVRSFLISKFEATVPQANPREMRESPEGEGWFQTATLLPLGSEKEVIARLKTLGLRLPTKYEWQRAALGGSDSPPTATELDVQAWHAGNSGKALHTPGRRAPNAYGLHDVLGNVAEWCVDSEDGNAEPVEGLLFGGDIDTPGAELRNALAGEMRRSAARSAGGTFLDPGYGVRPARDVPTPPTMTESTKQGPPPKPEAPPPVEKK